MQQVEERREAELRARGFFFPLRTLREVGRVIVRILIWERSTSGVDLLRYFLYVSEPESGLLVLDDLFLSSLVAVVCDLGSSRAICL